MGTPSFAQSDSGNADYFAAHQKDQVLYDHLRGKWFIWTGRRWQPDTTAEIYRRMLSSIRQRQNDCIADHAMGNEDRARELRHCLRGEDGARLEAAIKLARSRPGISDDGKRWDLNPWLLGCENGVVNLRNGGFMLPDPKHYITQSVGYDWDSQAKCPMWEGVFASYWDDADVRTFVYRALGYSVSGSTQEQALFCLYGLGSNGKSTLLGAIRDALGDYSYTMPFSTISMDNRSQINNDVASLVGKRFVMSSEAQEDERLNEGRIKSLTGDTTLTARFLYREHFTFVPLCKLWLAFNHKPRVMDDSFGFWRRLKFIPAEKQFNASNRIKSLDSILAAEAPGILNWLIRACLEWQEAGLELPSPLVQATEIYREENNPLREYVGFCDLGELQYVPITELYLDYRQWCKQFGERPIGKIQFGRRILSMGISTRKRKVNGVSTWCYEGIDKLPR